MALISWGDEEDQRKDLFGNPIKTVTSVQSGSWQPAPSGADAPAVMEDQPKVNNGIFDQPQPQSTPQTQDNYLVSDEKAQVDEQKRQRDIQIENARRQAAAQAAAARQAAFQEGQVETRDGQPIDVNEVKKDDGWKKYYDKAFEREKADLGFWGRLLDGGQASKRAETAARAKYSRELMRRGFDDNGNVVDQAAVDRVRKLNAYNSALAQDVSDRAAALVRMSGADKTNIGFWDKVKATINNEKTMSLYDALFGVNNGQKKEANDVGRFVGNLVQGIPTMPFIGAKEIQEGVSGRGTNYQTGMEEDLTGAQRFGRGASGALNVVTPFVGGSGKLLDSLSSKVLTNTATEAEKTLLKRMTSEILFPAIEQGAIGGAQAGSEYFGNGNTLLDENGDFDKKKLLEFTKQVGEAGGMGFAGGVVMGGAGMGINRLRNGRQPTIDAADLADIETRTTNAAEAEIANTRLADMEGTNLKSLEEGGLTPVREPVADGIAIPEDVTPINDGNIAFEPVNDPTPAFQRGYGDVVEPVTSKPNEQLAIEADIRKTQGLDPAEDLTPAFQRQAEDGGITPVTDVPEVQAPDVTPVADGVVRPIEPTPIEGENTPVLPPEQVRALEEARAGKSQAEEAVINQKIQEAQSAVPTTDSLPEAMAADAATPNTDMINRAISTLDEPKEYITQVASAISPDGQSPIKAEDMRETLDMYGDKGDAALKDRIVEKYNRLRQMVAEYNVPQTANRKAFAEGGIDATDATSTRARSALQTEMGLLQKDLAGDIRKLTAQVSGKERAKMIYDNLNSYRKSNMLLSAPSIERNVAQDIIGLMNDVVKNPKLMGKALTSFPAEYVRSLRKAARDWTVPPKSISELPKYIIGNAYESMMSLSGVEGAVSARTTGYRQVEARNMLEKLGQAVTKENIDKMSKLMGNEAELMAHTAAGVANFMTSNTQFKRASDAFNAYIESGDPLAKQRFLDNVARQSTVTEQIKQKLITGDSPLGKVAATALDFISPFVRTATNAVDTTITGTLNPFSKSAADYILKSNRSTGRNIAATLQNKAIDGAVIAGTVGLINSGVISYNNGEDASKPQGISIKVGENTYVPIRATHVELTIALVYAAMEIQKDIENGDVSKSNIGKYVDIIDGSLPYVDSVLQTNKAIGSAASDGNSGDNGYAAKAYGVNTIKSYVPAANNNLQPYVESKQGKSINAKSSYDKDFPAWVKNAVGQAYLPAFRAKLPDSRDAAGRVRTVDNQGVFINKTINDTNTREFNDRVTDLIKYGQKSKFGKNVQDMFNTYDTGKNNNFKSVQDAITFTDAVDGKPDNTKKLEKNSKLAGLSKQIRDGFFGESGSELLELDGQTLKSDASVPNKSGTKNSKLPISMQSIKNAIAQTDLPKDQSDKLYEISGQSTELYNQLKAKQITYEQYSAAKAALGAQEVEILSGSESYQKMQDLFNKLDESGFFNEDGLGSTRSGQTYLWNALNALLASKGATPAANYPDTGKGYTPWGRGGGRRGSGRGATNKPGDRGNKGIQWTPVGKRQMANVASAQYTPVKVKVKLGNVVKKDRSQNYSDRTF